LLDKELYFDPISLDAIEEAIEDSIEDMDDSIEDMEDSIEGMEDCDFDPLEPLEPLEDSDFDPLEAPLDSDFELLEDSMEDPMEDPIEDSIEDPIEDSIEDPIEDSIEDPIEDSIEDPMEAPLEDSVEDPEAFTHFFHPMEPSMEDDIEDIEPLEELSEPLEELSEPFEELSEPEAEGRGTGVSTCQEVFPRAITMRIERSPMEDFPGCQVTLKGTFLSLGSVWVIVEVRSSFTKALVASGVQGPVWKPVGTSKVPDRRRGWSTLLRYKRRPLKDFWDFESMVKVTG